MNLYPAMWKWVGLWCLYVDVHYVGGTSVSSALECPPEEQRMIVSLDTSQMVCPIMLCLPAKSGVS